MNRQSRIFVAGHRGLVGSALMRRLEKDGYNHVITRTHSKLDLAESAAVEAFFHKEEPEYVVLAAAKVGGIHANSTLPAAFIHSNLSIQTSVIHAAYLAGVKRLIFFGSNCVYPKYSSQPMREEDILSGPLESTSEPFAVAKLAGIKMCEAYNREYDTCFVSVIPATLYGPNDNFDSTSSHVLSGLMARFHQAALSRQENVSIWGSGRPRREFLYVDDLANACLFLMGLEDSALRGAVQKTGGVINAGSGVDLSILQLATMIQQTTGFQGQIETDPSLPDGVAARLLDSHRIMDLGWQSTVSLEEGIQRTYSWYREIQRKVGHGIQPIL